MKTKELAGNAVRRFISMIVVAFLLSLSVNVSPGAAASAEASEGGTFGNCTWEIDDEGRLTIAPIEGTDGKLGIFQTSKSAPWYEFRETIKSGVVNEGVIATSVDYMFSGCSSLIELDLSGLDTSEVTSMEGMFSYCPKLTTLDVSGWDTSNVTDMYQMFRGCSNLTTLDVSSWDTSSVVNMSCMFMDCYRLTNLDVSRWNTSSATEMDVMFYGCSSLETLDVSGWDTSSVSDLSGMFRDCASLEFLDVSGWDTSSVKNGPLSDVTGLGEMFYGCSSLETLDVSGWDTSNVTDMYQMFYGCSSLRFLDTSNWDVSGGGNKMRMFYGCSSLEFVDVSGWKVGSVSGMFYGCSSLETLDVSGWDVSSVYVMDDLFRGCSSLETLDVSGWDTSKVYDMTSVFRGCSNLKALDVSAWDVASVGRTLPSTSNMNYMFYGCSSLESLDLSGWEVFTNVYESGMSQIFGGCTSLSSLVLGDMFKLNTNMGLPSGAWQSVGLGTVNEPQGKLYLTTNALISGHNSSALSETYVFLKKVDEPIANSGLTYTGLMQEGVKPGDGYALVGVSSSVNAGRFEVVAELDSGYIWSDGTTEDKIIEWSIAKATYDMSGVSFDGETVAYDGAARFIEVSGVLPEGVTVSYEGNGAVDAGTYEVIAAFSGDSENYEPVPDMAATLVIEPAVLTAVYGGETVAWGVSPSLIVSVTGFVGEEDASSASGYVSPRVLAPPLERGASYELIPSGGSADNYAFEYMAGILSVGPEFVDAPTAFSGFVYMGSDQVGVAEGDGYALFGEYAAADAGDYVAVATLLPGFAWEDGTTDPKVLKWSIAPASIEDVTGLSVPDQIYTSMPIEPGVSLSFGSLVLEEGVDYCVSYHQNIAIGDAYVQVTGMGNFAGTVDLGFSIVSHYVDFEDTPKDAWYVANGTLDYVIEHGIMNGTSGTTFAPSGKVTRAQVAMILYNLAGKPEAGEAEAFADVKAGAWYYDAVTWARSVGVISGYGNGKFGPNDNVTREQLALMLRGYAGNVAGIDVTTGAGELAGFADAGRVSSWAYDAVAWCVGQGIISGSPSGDKVLVNPKGTAVRAEAAQMVRAFDEKVLA